MIMGGRVLHEWWFCPHSSEEYARQNGKVSPKFSGVSIKHNICETTYSISSQPYSSGVSLQPKWKGTTFGNGKTKELVGPAIEDPSEMSIWTRKGSVFIPSYPNLLPYTARFHQGASDPHSLK